MFLSQNTFRMASVLLIVCFVVLAIFSLGDVYIFNQIYFIILLFSAFYVRKNINLLGITSILILGKALEQLMFFALAINENTQWGLYFVGFLSSLIFRKERCFKAFLVVLCISLYCDLYNLGSQHLKPEAIWYLFLSLNAFITRKLVMMRPFTTAIYFPEKAEPITLDHTIHGFFGILVWVNLIVSITLVSLTAINLTDTSLLQRTHIYTIQAIMFLLLLTVLRHSIRLIRKDKIRV